MLDPRQKNLVGSHFLIASTLGNLDGNTVTWYWIGSHDEYERLYS